MNAQIIGVVVGSLFSGGLGATLIGWLRDHRKNRAEAAKAEAQADIEVDAARLAPLERRLTLLQKTWDAERASLRSTIEHVRSENLELRALSEEKDHKIAKLATQLSEVQEQMATQQQHMRNTERQLGQMSAELEKLQHPDII